MRNTSLAILAFVLSTFLSSPPAHAADVVYNPAESVGEPNGATDFTGFGSAGYLLDAVQPVSLGSPSGKTYSGVNPLNFSEPGGGFATSNQLSSSLFTAINLDGNYVEAKGHAYGNEPNGNFDYIGLGGTQNATSAEELKLTFNQSSPAGYRIAILTQSNGNGNGVDGITLYTGGTSLATATSSSTNSNVLTGNTVFYSFDVTNITEGDSLTVDLFDPQNGGNLLTYGFTLDALPAVPEPATLMTGGALFVVALVKLCARIKDALPTPTVRC